MWIGCHWVKDLLLHLLAMDRMCNVVSICFHPVNFYLRNCLRLRLAGILRLGLLSMPSTIKENADVTKNRGKISEPGLKYFLPHIAPPASVYVQFNCDSFKLL